MCTPLTHAVISAAAGGILGPRKKPRGFWLWVVVCGVVADVDSIGLRFGIPYDHLLGHRGLTHSLLFVLLVSVLVVSLLGDVGVFARRWWRLLGLLAGIMVVHDCLDAMTNGGLGVAFFAPFENGRYWLGWRPIPVSPIGLRSARV